MSNPATNNDYLSDGDAPERSPENNHQVRQLIYRIFPFWPLIILALVLGTAAGYLLLRYATPVYQVRSRLVVNDDEQEKSANLQSIINLDTRDLSAETEKEIELLRSTDLLKKVASQLQLNVQYFQKGKIKSGQGYDNKPFSLELQSPDSIRAGIGGEVKIVNGKIEFNNEVFATDTFVAATFGTIKWHINPWYRGNTKLENWSVSINSTLGSAKQLKSALAIIPISKKSSIVDLIYTDLFPSRGLAVLNTLIKNYGTATVDYKSRIYENTQRFLDERLNLVSEQLSGVEKKEQTYKTTEHIVDLSTEGSLYLNKLKTADTKIGEIDVQLDVLKQIEIYVTRRNNSNSEVPATLGISDAILSALLTQLYQSEFELEKVKQLSGDKNPQVPVLEEIISKLRPSILSSINNLKLSLEASRKRLQSDNESLNSFISKMPFKERVLLDISRERGIKDAIYTYLLQKREESAIAAASILPNYRLIERPEFAGLVSPNTKNYYLFSITITLLLAIIFIYLREFANSRLLFRSQIESKLDIPIIGELIFKPNETGSPVVIEEGKRTLIAEQFRELRTNLNYIVSLKEGKCKIILTTSSIPGEGKTFVAINTAVSFSLTGAKVVLLEFDLRKPKISRELGIAREPGLSNYLINMADEKDIIKAHSTISNFSIIPSGPIPPNPAELIGSKRLTELITYLKEHFDYIIIDSPPVGAVTDAKILAAVADTTLYIVRHNYSNDSSLQMIQNVQQKKILPAINIVFNGITPKQILGYSYGREYGYGYGYGYGYSYAEESAKRSWWKRLLTFKKGS